ncbi:hypothetical protein ASN88_00500 [Streptococcus parauberis]|uniref:hypothetical protein n=1 Tax=Streptococcus parauberis TaxID=1348 RepID=UPI000CCE6AB7|nr:hypothetical protein [Streptococcus parauberis]PNY22390.1 hypothetical protein ASN88_00500 [Streptococcus parauberis]
MKIKSLILVLSSFLLIACSNASKETAESSFGKKVKTEQTSKSSSIDNSSNSLPESTSESSSDSSKSNIENTEDAKNVENEPYSTYYIGIGTDPNQLRDGFYSVGVDQNTGETSIIAQFTNGHEVDNVQIKTNEMESFVDWIRKTAPDGSTKNGLQSNYDYWVKNVKQ